MKIIEPSIRVLAASVYEPPEVPFSYTVEPELLIEYAGRTCYASRDKAAHPQMRQIAVPILGELKRLFPEYFRDIETPTFEYNLDEVK